MSAKNKFLLVIVILFLSIGIQSFADAATVPLGKSVCILKVKTLSGTSPDNGYGVWAICDGEAHLFLPIEESNLEVAVSLSEASGKFVKAGYILKNCSTDFCSLASR